MALSLSFALVANATWTSAPANPPTGNSSAPLNVSTASQTKNGNLIVNGLSATALCLPGSLPTGGCINMWSQVVGSGGTSQWTTSGSSIYYNGGNVGIGVASPTKKLEVNTAHAANIDDEIRLGSYYLNNFNGLGLNYRIDAAGTPSQHIVTYNAGTRTTNISLLTNGNVGIGNTAPGLPLEVKAPHAGGPATSGATQTGGLRLSQGDGAAALDMGINVTTGAGWLQSTVSTNLASVLPLLLNPNGGNVGIGTTNPGQALSVIKDMNGTQPAIMQLASNSGPNYKSLTLGYNKDLSYGYIQATTYNVSWDNLVINPNGGSVGIGTTNPSGKFESDGGGTWAGMFNYIAGNPSGAYGIWTSGTTYALYANGPIYATGSVTAPAFFYSSDARLKKNVEAIASSKALQDVLALQPVTYNWIDPTQPTTTQLGFIAQQVEQVVPELVTTNASTTLKAVDYARMTPLLVGAAQAQQAQIQTLEAQAASQQKEIDALVAEVAALKAGR